MHAHTLTHTHTLANTHRLMHTELPRRKQGPLRLHSPCSQGDVRTLGGGNGNQVPLGSFVIREGQSELSNKALLGQNERQGQPTRPWFMPCLPRKWGAFISQSWRNQRHEQVAYRRGNTNGQTRCAEMLSFRSNQRSANYGQKITFVILSVPLGR